MSRAAIHLARIARPVFATSAETAATLGFDSRHLYDRLRKRPAMPATQLLAEEGSATLRLGAPQHAARRRFTGASRAGARPESRLALRPLTDCYRRPC